MAQLPCIGPVAQTWTLIKLFDRVIYSVKGLLLGKGSIMGHYEFWVEWTSSQFWQQHCFFLFCVFCISCQKPLWPHIRGADLIPFSFLAVGFFLLRVTFCLMTADIKKKKEKKVSECRKVSNIKFFSVWVKVRYDVEALRGTFQCGACGSSRCRVWWWQLMG